MPIDQSSVATREYRNFKAEFADAGAHAINRSVVLPRVADIKDQSIDMPDLNFCGLRRLNHFRHSFTNSNGPSTKHDYRERLYLCKALNYMELYIAKECHP